MSILKEISENIVKCKIKPAEENVKLALEQGIPANEILEHGLIIGMQILGELFKQNKVFIPQLMLAAKTMNNCTAILQPHLIGGESAKKGRAVIGTVKGDQHDIGKNLVKMMFEGSGIEVIDLGANVPPEKFISTAKENNCKIIALSALLTTTMPMMKEVVMQAETAGIRNDVKIMIGGAPVTQSFCDEIKADAYTPDAASAAQKALEFLS